jgi:hypothetical protein
MVPSMQDERPPTMREQDEEAHPQADALSHLTTPDEHGKW